MGWYLTGFTSRSGRWDSVPQPPAYGTGFQSYKTSANGFNPAAHHSPRGGRLNEWQGAPDSAEVPVRTRYRLVWSSRQELNLQPTDYKTVALPVELQEHVQEICL